MWYCHTDKRYTVLISIIYSSLARMSNCVDVSKRIYFKRVFHQRLNGGLHISSVQFEISFVVDWLGFPCGNNGRQTETNYQGQNGGLSKLNSGLNLQATISITYT